MGFTTYRDACRAAHELTLRINDDVCVICADPLNGGKPYAFKYTVEPRFVGVRMRHLHDKVEGGRLIIAIVRFQRPGGTGGIESIFFHGAPCAFCDGLGWVNGRRGWRMGGYTVCGRCSGTGQVL